MIELIKKMPLVCLLALFLGNGVAIAQQKKSSTSKTTKSVKTTKTAKPSALPKAAEQTLITPEELEDYKRRVGSLVSFLEFALNTIGNDSTAAEDKEIITTRSYLKFFASNKVQIEDDLDEHRLVKTYKPVQAYLQDVDYFFKHVQFELNVEEITPYFENVAQPYFKVALTRYIKGKTNDGDSVFNARKRFIEINLDLKQKDIKIASIYTSPLNEGDDQLEWWNGVSDTWKQIFKKEMGAADSLNLGQIKRLQNTQELNLSGMTGLNDLTPLNRISALKILNISGTGVYDLTPLRNLTNLESLTVDGTLVKNFSALKYAVNLKELSFNNTNLDSMIDLSKFPKLEKLQATKAGRLNIEFVKPLRNLKILNLANNPFSDTKFLADLVALEYLDVSQTKVKDLDIIAKLLNLQTLNLSNTPVSQLAHLEELKKMRKLFINNTSIQTLDDLKKLTLLEKIYCDNTKISGDEARQFMINMPACLVVFESGTLTTWWTTLDTPWKTVFKKYIKMDDVPTQDQLARLVNQTEIEIQKNKDIVTLKPLKSFYNLKLLDVSGTAVTDVAPLEGSIHLEVLNLNGTQVKSLTPLRNITTLSTLYCEKTSLDSATINSYRNARPKTTVVYRTSYLRDWWLDVPDTWRAVFKKYVPYENSPTDEQLHAIVAIDSLKISDNMSVNNLLPVSKMDRIRIIQLINCKITDLSPLRNMQTLQSIDFTKNAIKDISPLASLANLKTLVLENTGLNQLNAISSLSGLEYINIAGTQVNELDAVEKFTGLQYLDISNSLISSLKPIEGNIALKQLKCYNTKLSEKKIAKFKATHPNCEVVYY